MRQPSLFRSTPTVRESSSPAAKAAAQFQRDNLQAAKRAFENPDKYAYLLGWATIVLKKNGLLDESEAA